MKCTGSTLLSRSCQHLLLLWKELGAMEEGFVTWSLSQVLSYLDFQFTISVNPWTRIFTKQLRNHPNLALSVLLGAAVPSVWAPHSDHAPQSFQQHWEPPLPLAWNTFLFRGLEFSHGHSVICKATGCCWKIHPSLYERNSQRSDPWGCDIAGKTDEEKVYRQSVLPSLKVCIGTF